MHMNVMYETRQVFRERMASHDWWFFFTCDITGLLLLQDMLKELPIPDELNEHYFIPFDGYPAPLLALTFPKTTISATRLVHWWNTHLDLPQTSINEANQKGIYFPSASPENSRIAIEIVTRWLANRDEEESPIGF